MKLKHLFRFALFSLLLSLPAYSAAQTNIEPYLLYSDTVTFPFTSEWQYLSTDIFLFNPDKFGDVINELDFYEYAAGKKRRKKKKSPQEWIEYLFITASLRNVRFFGDAEVTYPLYHFQVSSDPKMGYQSLASDNIDHVRVLDNLPLASAADNIDAEIRVHAITGNNGDMILQMVASQLKNIAKITTPIGAVMSLVGEFGNLLDANTKKREYRFSSTIRLFEQRNFDRRLHSIKIYELKTANSKHHEMATAPLRQFLDTVGLGIQTRASLRRILPARDYPLVVVLNYKSQYRVQPLTGDEVTFANIEKRKLKVENDFRQGVITPETYRQERDFAAFLTVFATFKNHLEVYKLNYRSGNTDAVAGSLFTLMQHYRGLVKSYAEMQYKYKGNLAFASLFAPEYQRIIGFADQYLADDYNLRSVQELVKTLGAIEQGQQPADALALESAIKRLRFSDHFQQDMMNTQPEGQLIRGQLARLEENLYRVLFLPQIDSLARVPATNETRNAPQNLLRLTRATSCMLCRDSAYKAVDRFNVKVEQLDLKRVLLRRDSLVNSYSPWVFSQVATLQRVRENYNTFYAPDTTSKANAYLAAQVEQAEVNLAHLQEFMELDLHNRSLETVQTLVERLEVYHTRLEENLRTLHEMAPILFEEQKIENHTPKSAPEVTEETEQPIETTLPSAPNNTSGDKEQEAAQ